MELMEWQLLLLVLVEAGEGPGTSLCESRSSWRPKLFFQSDTSRAPHNSYNCMKLPFSLLMLCRGVERDAD